MLCYKTVLPIKLCSKASPIQPSPPLSYKILVLYAKLYSINSLKLTARKHKKHLKYITARRYPKKQ